MTADAAARGIRSVDEEGSIGIVSEEADPPYDRPPLSKGLWKDAEVEIDRHTADLGVELHLDHRVLRIDPDDRTVTGDRGVIYTYDRLLLATGGRPRELDDAVPHVIYYRTLEDYRRLRKAVEDGRSFVVVGGSFIGSEMAAALAAEGREVTLLFPEEGICAGLFPPDLALHLNDYYRERGVDVRPGVGVASIRRSGDRLLVATEEDDPSDTLRADAVVAGLGIVPNQELAGTAGLDVVPLDDDGEEYPGLRGGILVDGRFRTSAPDVYAAGDVAVYWCPVLGKRRRVEHEDQANSSGYHAGRCMAGEDEEYDHLPFFYADLFDLGYEAVGELDPALEVVRDWEEEFRRGVLYYLEQGRVRGVLLWGAFGHVEEARALIRSGERFSADSVRGRIDLQD